MPRRTAGDFLRRLIAVFPYELHTVLTDNGIHFTTPAIRVQLRPTSRRLLAPGSPFRAHAFEYACAHNDIDHRMTKTKHPWTNGQVERMNRTIKDATVKRYFYETHDQLCIHLRDFVDAYNFAKRLNIRPSEAAPLTSSSAKTGLPSRRDLQSVRSSKCRD